MPPDGKGSNEPKGLQTRKMKMMAKVSIRSCGICQINLFFSDWTDGKVTGGAGLIFFSEVWLEYREVSAVDASKIANFLKINSALLEFSVVE